MFPCVLVNETCPVACIVPSRMSPVACCREMLPPAVAETVPPVSIPLDNRAVSVCSRMGLDVVPIEPLEAVNVT